MLELELNDGNGLVHLSHQDEALIVILFIRVS